MTLETEMIPVTDRESWLGMRKQDVTASDVAAVFGLHPYKTPLQLWADKTGVGLETPDNAAMRRGRWMEDAVIAACRDTHPDWEITKPGIYVRAPAVRLGCTPDALANKTINVQCKTVAASTFKSWDDGPPVHYQLQALTEGLLLGAEKSILAVLVTSSFGADYYEYEIPRHASAEQKILDAVPAFWAQIERGEQPKPEYAADGELLAKLHSPDSTLPPLDLSGDNYAGALLEKRERLSKEAAAIKDELEAVNAELRVKLAGHVIATLPGWTITNKMQTRKSYVVKESSFPVLRCTRTEQKDVAA